MPKVADFGLDLEALTRRLESLPPPITQGKVTQAVGLLVEGFLPKARIGGLCEISVDGEQIEAEVVGFRGRTTLLMPLKELGGVQMGSLITPLQSHPRVPVSEGLLGRVIDGLGQPLDGTPLPPPSTEVPLYAEPPSPLQRPPIRSPLWLGIRAVDSLLTVGRGQRMGIFAGSGVGKSVLLGMMARNAISDVNVIALIGERGREVLEFIQRDLGEEGLKRSVVIAATSDTAPLVRVRAANLATSIAEFFRDRGADVLLMMDSLTRYAMAQREIGLAAGEPPTTRGYPPSVYSRLPRLLERAGNSPKGSITGLYTVLVEGDDLNDPIGDTVRSIIDGHISLSRELAAQNHYPAIDVLYSASRVMNDVIKPKHKRSAGQVRALMAAHRKAEDLIHIGAYKKGADPLIDRAIERIQGIRALLCQEIEDRAPSELSIKRLHELAR